MAGDDTIESVLAICIAHLVARDTRSHQGLKRRVICGVYSMLVKTGTVF